jgi:hypothetical protein
MRVMMRRLALLVFAALPLFADAKLEDLSFMAGHWSGGGIEEVWLAPKNGLMTGMNRTIHNGRASFEFFRIAETKDGIVYLTQPGGRPATAFKLISLEGERATFANPEHDFPKRILYFRKDAQLCARIEGDEPNDAQEWCWSRVK